MKSIFALMAFGLLCPWGVDANAAIIDCMPAPNEILNNSTEAVTRFNKSLDSLDIFC